MRVVQNPDDIEARLEILQLNMEDCLINLINLRQEVNRLCRGESKAEKKKRMMQMKATAKLLRIPISSMVDCGDIDKTDKREEGRASTECGG